LVDKLITGGPQEMLRRKFLSSVGAITAAVVMGMSVSSAQASTITGYQVCMETGLGLECIHDTGHNSLVGNYSGPISLINFTDPVRTPNGNVWRELQSSTGMCLNATVTRDVFWDSCVGDANELFYVSGGQIISLYGNEHFGHDTWLVYEAAGDVFVLNPAGEFDPGSFFSETAVLAPWSKQV